MADEVTELVIRADGLADAQQAVRATERALERLQRRAERLARLRITPVAALIDRMSGPLNRVTARLVRLTKKPWVVRLGPQMDVADFAVSGFVAGTAFLDKFLTAFDTDKIAQKAQGSLNEVTVNVKLGDSSSGGGNWLTTMAQDMLTNLLYDVTIGRVLGKIGRRGGSSGGGSGKPPAAKQGKTPSTKKILGPDGKVLREVPPSSTGVDGATEKRKNNVRKTTQSMGFANALADRPTGKVLNSPLFKGAARVFRPLSVVSDVMNIAGAKTGKERSKAIGRASGGWAGAVSGAAWGASIGSIVPGIGTAAGGLIGGAIGGIVGSGIGEKIGGAANKAIGWLFGKGKKKAESPPPPPPKPKPAPATLPKPAIGPPLAAVGADAGFQQNVLQQRPQVNVHLPIGAVQLTVKETELDYSLISAEVGNQIASAIQRAMENRA